MKKTAQYLKKTVLASVLVLFSTVLTYAQQDSVYTSNHQVSKENEGIPKYQYIDQSLFERKTLFKYSIEIGAIDPDQISVERKIWPSTSLELGWGIPRMDRSSLFTKFRYYPNKRKNAPESKKKINNFTGNYVVLGYLRNFSSNGNDFNNTEYDILNLGFGHQHKVGKWLFFDVSANLQYINNSPGFGDTFQFELRMDVGPAYGKAQGYSYDLNNRFADFKSTYSSRKSVFKLSNPALTFSRRFTAGGLSASYERKLFSDFSINTRINTGASSQSIRTFSNNEKIEIRALSSSFDLEIRYYYGKDKRLQKGAEVRDFSGPYVAAGVLGLYSYRNLEVDGESDFVFPGDSSGTDFISYELKWGVQKIIGKRAFINVHVGPVYNTYNRDFDILLQSEIGIMLGK